MEQEIALRGWLAASQNLKITCLGEYSDLGDCVQYSNLLRKFPQDQIFLSDAERVCFLDGYIYNKEAFLCKEGFGEWPESFAYSFGQDAAAHFRKLRGAFGGYIYEKAKKSLTVYTDQVSNKTVYYYCENDRWMISDRVDFMVRVLQANDIAYQLHIPAVQYMLTCGYMLDDSTFVSQIRRVLPGHYAELSEKGAAVRRYYEFPTGEASMSEAEAVERIDAAFRQAVEREFSKDREYGYRHLVDLSGGLDSRMVSWVAHDLGFRDQVNITYSRSGYLDQRISEQIAGALKHEYFFKPLDDLAWMYDVDEMTCKNNGAAVALGMTGGNRMLKELNTAAFGIEHTGMLGDVILSSYDRDENLAKGAPRYGYHQYSTMMQYAFDPKLLERYRTQEAFVITTRGILGMQSSYMTRQNYVEAGSPFLDPDFLEAVMAVPFAYRNSHRIYLKWIKEKYPGAAEFIWEKWGVKPKESEILKRKVKTTGKLARGYLRKAFHRPDPHSMNPLDYWYQNDIDVRNYLETMYEERIGSSLLPEELRADMKRLFAEGGFTEKSLVLTVLSAVHLFFERDIV